MPSTAEHSVVLEFEPRIGDAPFDCTQSIDSIGSRGVPASPVDFRLFVHDVELILPSGQRSPLALENDGIWQQDGVALLDFEDGSGTCENGTPDVRRELRGTTQHTDYSGVAFKLGVPLALNHLDGGGAGAPLNTPGMWWTWQNGYRYLRFEVNTAENPGGFIFHLGGTECEGSVATGFGCRYENVVPIEVQLGGQNRIVLDAGALFAEVDPSQKPDRQTDFVAGCMASPGDEECPPMFAALGAGFEDRPAPKAAQRVFRGEDEIVARARTDHK